VGSPYRAITVESMHQADIGIFKTLVNCVKALAKIDGDQSEKAILTELDRRLKVVRDSSRILGWRLPGGKNGYFCSNATFQAFEHRAVMQVGYL
jgi:hypothetical protein